MSHANPNLRYAEIFVNGLAQAGLRAVCIAPGSRSTPLTLAFHAHPQVQVFAHLDERSASFFALGLALATDRPVALVCTSGTAAVEFHPALVEAYQAQVPLLALTGDRPPELRHSGANQTIDQVKMYGDHVLWSVDAPLPEPTPPDVALRNLRTLAARAYARADGLPKGPVHVNFPFRKPLEPEPPYHPDFSRLETSTARLERGALLPTSGQVSALARLLDAHERGWIVCGPRCPGGDFPGAVAALARRTGYPILADPLSGVRFGPHTQDAMVLSTYETFLQAEPPWEPPSLVLRFGAPPTSKWLNAYLDRVAPDHQVHVRASGVWGDDSHRVTHFLQAEEAAVCWALTATVQARGPGDWARGVWAGEEAARARHRAGLETAWFDAAVIPLLMEALPEGSNLVLGNSLPVRHVDQFAAASTKALHVYGNRGASGIDGVVSTALGVAAADVTRPTVLLIGDVSFYHDLNGLLAVGRLGLRNVTIVLLDNKGGGIFRRLPIARHDPPFQDLFVMPHGLDFAPLVQAYGLAYTQVQDR
ncbi:MAG: 2-succinyl-5-enolpyruvyl-6-hydroxy-3-cyclohexene-1-carboxylic-acid synthase, partial [Caldilineae bacterium]